MDRMGNAKKLVFKIMWEDIRMTGKNKEGYPDPTASKAIQKWKNETERQDGTGIPVDPLNTKRIGMRTILMEEQKVINGREICQWEGLL